MNPFSNSLTALALALALAGCATAPAPPRPPARSAPPSEQPLPILSEGSPLADFQHYAALNNPGLQAAFLRWQAALEGIPQAAALPDPRITYGYFIQSVETRVGPQQHRVGVSQTLPWFGKRTLRGDAAAREAEARYQELEAARVRLASQVKDAYCELYYLRRALALTDDNINLLKSLEGVAQTRMRGGAGLAAISKAQVELGKLEDQRRSLQKLRAPLTARLNTALNRPPESPGAWPASLNSTPMPWTDKQLLAALAEINPDLKRLESLAAGEGARERLARRDAFPDVTLGLDYTQTDDAINRLAPDSGKDPVMATLSLNIPLWREKYAAAVRAASDRRAAHELERVQREKSLASSLELALYHFHDAGRKIDLYQNALTPLAQQSLQVVQKAWEAGEADFFNVIDANRLLLEFQLQIERALSSREQRLAEIESLIGRDIRSLQPPSSPDPNPALP